MQASSAPPGCSMVAPNINPFLTGENLMNSPNTNPLLAADCLNDMLDYRLYLLYRDSGWLMERMIQDKFGLNRRRWRIIAALHESHEGATLSEIAERAELDRAQASRTVGTMCREGWLKRLSNPDNARYAKVIFTDKSRTLYDAILKEWRIANRQLLDALTPAEIDTLDSIFNKLRQRVQDLKGRQHGGAT